MTLGGCFQFTSGGSPGLPATLPRDCQEKLANKVPDPGAKEGEPLDDIAAGYKAAWLKANHRIGAIRACDNKQADAVDRGAR
jgi:hypothetical protein